MVKLHNSKSSFDDAGLEHDASEDPKLNLTASIAPKDLDVTDSSTFVSSADNKPETPNLDEDFDEAAVLTECSPPFAIKSVNKEWLTLCGFEHPEQVVGQSLSILQGPASNLDAVDRMMDRLLHPKTRNSTSSAILTNYRRIDSARDDLREPFSCEVAASRTCAGFLALMREEVAEPVLSYGEFVAKANCQNRDQRRQALARCMESWHMKPLHMPMVIHPGAQQANTPCPGITSPRPLKTSKRARRKQISEFLGAVGASATPVCNVIEVAPNTTPVGISNGTAGHSIDGNSSYGAYVADLQAKGSKSTRAERRAELTRRMSAKSRLQPLV